MTTSSWWEFVLQDVFVGALTGLVVAFVAARLMPRGASAHQKSLYALGVALRSPTGIGGPRLPEGNGFIAAFVAGVALGVAEHDIPEAFQHFNENVSAIFQVATFFLFGALIVDTHWGHGAAALALFIGFALLVARPAAVLVSLAGTRRWHGP